jgi:hypothetical protein
VALVGNINTVVSVDDKIKMSAEIIIDESNVRRDGVASARCSRSVIVCCFVTCNACMACDPMDGDGVGVLGVVDNVSGGANEFGVEVRAPIENQRAVGKVTVREDVKLDVLGRFGI